MRRFQPVAAALSVRNKELSAPTDISAVRKFPLRIAADLRRGEYFAGLYVIGCASGFSSRMVQSTQEIGWAASLFSTFGISLIVWGSCIAGVSLVLRDKARGVRAPEILLGSVFISLVVLPVGALSWIAVAGLSLYILFFTGSIAIRRGASILLAVTVPMLWSRVLFNFFAQPILDADAAIVSWLLDTYRNGNLVGFADGSGQLAIYPPCSSLANVSLAILCWVALSEVTLHKKSTCDFLWCVAACAGVVAVNVSRMAIMGLSQGHYYTVHNQWGDMVANVITLALIVGISAAGVRRELFQRV